MSIGNSLAIYQKRRAPGCYWGSSGTVVIYKIGVGVGSLYYIPDILLFMKQCFGNFVLYGFLFVVAR